MDFLQQFVNYLNSKAGKPSKITVKNYRSDISQFLRWLETRFNKEFAPQSVTIEVIKLYQNEKTTYSPRSLKRQLSSLRQFFLFLKTMGIQPKSPFEQISSPRKAYESDDKWHLKSFKNYLYINNKSRLTIKNYLSDVKHFLAWAEQVTGVKDQWIVKEKNIFDKINTLVVEEYKQRLGLVFSKRTINRKLSSLRTYLAWAKQKGDRIKNYRKEVYAPLLISTKYFPWHKKLWHHIRYTRPKWYKTYHSNRITYHFHLSILILFMSSLGFGIYNSFVPIPKSKDKVLGTMQTAPPRVLTLQGRITDTYSHNLVSPTPITLTIYNDPVSSGSSLLWQEVTSAIPNADGNFSILVGSKNPIPQSIFSQNSSLWLGIIIGDQEELSPRQEIPTAGLSTSAETLQGLYPITSPKAGTKNVILALDSSGNLSIGGSASPTFQATNGQLTLSGNVLLLTTAFGSNNDVVISPDGLGKIDLQKPLQNTLGAVEINDLFAILATSSGQAAVTINQDSTGPILTASSSSIPRLTIDSSGNFISTPGASWKPFSDSKSSLSIASASGIPFVTFDTLNARVGIGGDASIDETLTIGGNVAIASGGLIGSSNNTIQLLNSTTRSMVFQTGTTGDRNIIFNTNGANERLRIDGGSGRIGIGTTNPLLRLDLRDSQESTAAAQIFNTNAGTDADGIIIKLGNTSTTEVANANHFISFETSGIGIVGSVKGSGGKGVTYATSGVADFAEYFKKDENQIIEYGSLVCIAEEGFALACDQTHTKLVGVASEQPAFLGGEDLGNNSIAVGLVGHVYTKVSNQNGIIKPGDSLSSSSIPGIAVKATKPGQIVGRALEAFRTDGNTSEACRGRKLHASQGGELASLRSTSGVEEEVRCGKILVSVSVASYDPDIYLTSAGDLNISPKQSSSQNEQVAQLLNGYIVKNAAEQVIKRIGIFSEIVVANLRAGFIKAEEVSVESITVASDSVTIAGENLKDYILNIANNVTIEQLSNRAIVSPIAKIDEVQTNIISPLSSHSLRIHLGRVDSTTSEVGTQSGKLIVENASGSAVATIDSSGNASFSGRLSSDKLEVTNDATVGGILRARKILAENIEGLEAKVSSLSGAPSSPSIPNNSLTASFGTFTHGLMSFGPTSLADVGVVGQLSLGGTLILADNSINVLASNLELQPLRQGGISFLSGLVRIDEVGNLEVSGKAIFANDVSIKGSLTVNIISPIPDSDLVVKNSSGSAVLSISQGGDLVASGSGTFSKLNLKIAKQALALSPTHLLATGSAGIASLSANFSEITIDNDFVNENSLIYITAVGTPSAQIPFLIRQAINSFTVGVQTPTQNPLPFNWLIVN